MSKILKKTEWSPWSSLLQSNKPNNYGILVLNRPINFIIEPNILTDIWNQAKIRITVDGGTDCWQSWQKTNDVDTAVVPDLITGDMDSITNPTLKHFKNKSKIVVTEDQNETDFTKALRETERYCRDNDLDLTEMFALSEISGRFDQLISNINTLFKMRNIMPYCKLYLLCPDSITWLLEEGEHRIEIPHCLLESKQWCGLLPVGSPCQVTTTGLKWNLDKSILEFGNLISSSNTYSGENVVTVQTDSPIVWTMGIDGLL